jgi:hypothetical protein
MVRRAYRWSVPIAGLLVLLGAGIGGIASASDSGTRRYGPVLAAFVAVVGLGLLARRRWAVWAGFGVAALSAVLTVLAFASDAQADPAWMMVEFTGLLLILLLPALWWRPTGPETDAGSESTRAGEPRGLSQMLLFGLVAVPTVLVGMALLLVVAFGWMGGGFNIGAVLVLVACLALFGSGTVALRPRRRTMGLDLARLSIDGTETPAFLARYDRLGRAAGPAGVAGMAVLGVCILAETDLPRLVWVLAAVLAGLAVVGLAVLAATREWRAYVALLPSGLYVPGPRQPTFVPWSAVTSSFLLWSRTEPFVTMSVSDPAAIRTSGAGRLLLSVNRPFGGDLHFPARILVTEPEFLAHTIDVYRSCPSRRQAIGTADELHRLRTEWGRERRTATS